jgi:hypothetical protein
MQDRQVEPQRSAAPAHRPNGNVPPTDAVKNVWKRFRLAHGAKPIVGAVIVGGAAVALAAQVGALELAIGALTAYTAYRMLRYGVDLKDALVQTIEIEHEARAEV